MIEEVHDLLRGKRVTSYNRHFDVDVWLKSDVWGVKCMDYPCIMLLAKKFFEKDFNLKLKRCAANLLGNGRAYQYKEHTAPADAETAAKVLIEMLKKSRRNLSI